MFELISNTCLYNIVFVNNLPSYLKNFGSATGYQWVMDYRQEQESQFTCHLWF
jgi:hypothetical protein